jgi:hypothetical protein
MMNKNSTALNLNQTIKNVKPSRGFLFGFLILGALLAFEIFNYSTTDYALTDLIGNPRFLGLRWATILAIAFCGIDFAGIARLFTPEKGAGELKEVWYLFGAWILAATMNAILTWWGVAIAILNHTSLGSEVMDRDTIIKIVPIFVAIMVWIIRVLIIGSFSVAGDRLFSQSSERRTTSLPSVMQRKTPLSPTTPVPAPSVPYNPATLSQPKPARPVAPRVEPTYHPASMSGARQPHVQVRK